MARKVYRLKDAVIERLALCKVGANNQRVFLMKSADEDDEQVARFARLIKAADDWSVAYVPVAVPDAEEGQGMFSTGDGAVDVWDSEAEIRRAAHGFMQHGAQIVAKHFDPQHADGVRLVENAVALDDFDVNGKTIKEGTWYVGLEFDEPLRELVAKGEIDAVSVEGFAERIAKDGIVQADPYERVAEDPETVNLDRFHNPAHPELVECMVWVEGRMWAIAGSAPPSAPQPQMAKIQQLAKDAILVPNKPGVSNWVERAGGLPKFIADIAGDLITERGKTTGQAIELAVGIVRNWCHGHGNVKADTRAKACAASAEWEAKKASAHAVAKAVENFNTRPDPLTLRLAKVLGIKDAEDHPVDAETGVYDLDREFDPIAKRSFSPEKRKELARKGHAMSNGGYPMENCGDVENAKKAVGRGAGGPNSMQAIKRHINKNARRLGCTPLAKELYDEALDPEAGTIGDVDLDERVEKVEGAVAEMRTQLLGDGTDEKPGAITQIAKAVDALAKKLPGDNDEKPDDGEKPDEGRKSEPAKLSKEQVDAKLDEIAEEFAGRFEPLAKRLEELEAGDTAQPEVPVNGNRQPVAKTTGFEGILF